MLACEASATAISHELQAVQRAKQRQREGALELKPESGPSPAQLAAHHHLCSLPQAFMWSPLWKPNSRGNVSLLASQETSMPKQGASWPDTALPVGYVRTFLPSLPLSLPSCFSLSLALSPTLLANCPSASCLTAILFFLGLSLGVSVCVSVSARVCVFTLFYAGPPPEK